MKARQIAIALAAAFPLAVITACDSQSDSDFLSSSQPNSEQGPATKQRPMTLAMLDKDRDGMVSRSEASDSPEIDERFSELDKDQDGRLSRPELDTANALPR